MSEAKTTERAGICRRCPLRDSVRRHLAGRPRSLSSKEEAAVVEWWDRRVTAEAKARELGISVSCLYNTLARYGRVKRRLTYKEQLVRQQRLDMGAR